MTTATEDLHRAEVRLREARHRRVLYNVRSGARAQRPASNEQYQVSLEQELQGRRELNDHPTAQPS